MAGSNVTEKTGGERRVVLNNAAFKLLKILPLQVLYMAGYVWKMDMLGIVLHWLDVMFAFSLTTTLSSSTCSLLKQPNVEIYAIILVLVHAVYVRSEKVCEMSWHLHDMSEICRQMHSLQWRLQVKRDYHFDIWTLAFGELQIQLYIYIFMFSH